MTAPKPRSSTCSCARPWWVSVRLAAAHDPGTACSVLFWRFSRFWDHPVGRDRGFVAGREQQHRLPAAPQGSAGGSAVPRAALPQVAQHSADLHHLLVAAATALVLLAVLSIAFGWLAAGRFLQPLRLITSATREMSATNLNERLRLNGPEDEIKELGDTFDALLERLERSFEAERRFVANASHELRTPLATMRASLDVAMAKPGPVPPQTAVLADRLRRELDHVDHLLASLLTLAQAQRAPAADEATVSLDELASAAIEQRSSTISEMGLRVDQERCPDACALGSETLLSRMVDNMVENAVKHNERGLGKGTNRR